MRQVFVILVAIVCLAHSEANISLYSGEVGRDGQLRALEYLGQNADKSKTFFMDKTVALSWSDAKKHCASTTPTGTRIASVYAGDYDFLFGKKDALGNGQIFWTSGRDAQDWPQFAWDKPEDNDDSTVDLGDKSGLDFYKAGFKTCVAFMIMKDGSTGRLAGLDCTAKYPPLCQLDA